MIRNAAHLLHWAEAVKQEECDLRVWMHSIPETSCIMDYIDYVDVLPELLVPLLKACKERYISGDSMLEGHLRSMIQMLHDWEILPALVSIIPSDWDCQGMSTKELAIIAQTLDTNYPGIRDELNGENWKINSLSLIKAISTLEMHARFREQEAYSAHGGQGVTRPDVGHHFISGDVAKFVIDNPDKCEEIVDVMLTRGTRDFDLISAIINSDVKAIISGVL